MQKIKMRSFHKFDTFLNLLLPSLINFTLYGNTTIYHLLSISPLKIERTREQSRHFLVL